MWVAGGGRGGSSLAEVPAGQVLRVGHKPPQRQHDTFTAAATGAGGAHAEHPEEEDTQSVSCRSSRWLSWVAQDLLWEWESKASVVACKM